MAAQVDFPVAFIFLFHDYEASQDLAYCHDKEYDIIDIFQFGHNIIGFYLFSNYQHCREYCLMQNFNMVSYQINSVNL